jgi:diketogulonate reductase-like aldo/keto reductase
LSCSVKKPSPAFTRRSFLQSVSGLALSPLLSLAPYKPLFAAQSPASAILTRRIPSTGEALPVIGMGTWLTFSVGGSEAGRARCVKILEVFFNRGGGLIDSSPMYGSSEEVIGHCLERISHHPGLFSATKVWIIGEALGRYQMNNSQDLWDVPRFDLMQIHNLLDWRSHLETLKEWKAAGRIRYIGITTSHGRRHEDLEQALIEEDFDFVQFSYNVNNRLAEQRLLPLAAERGIAVIINRPFQTGALFDRVRGKALPPWANEIEVANWAQFFLKYIISHPAVTCTIPATSQVAHMQENMGAGYGVLPDAAMRERMHRYFNSVT